jgi:hypothetical protein
MFKRRAVENLWQQKLFAKAFECLRMVDEVALGAELPNNVKSQIGITKFQGTPQPLNVIKFSPSNTSLSRLPAM